VAPPAYLRTARMPWRQRAAERLRPWINLACVRRPGVPPVLRGAGLVLATTPETERLLRRGGAGNVAVAFPDCTPTDAAAAALATRNDDRAAALADGVRLIWFGRALWWKGGQLAIELLRRLAATGVPCELSIHSFGAALESWRTRIAALGLSARCRIPGYVDRQTLLEELARTHVFVYPTIHDSSSSALLEAYAMGVPSLSTGVGGPALVATPATGYNERTPDLEAWLGAAVARAQQWQRDPAAWMAASAAARARAAEFGPGHVVRLAERWLSPAAYQR
ncbi:MAG TPA: glycosyltransferase, partial [Opitutus sp.]|nr:glycosyltransferase [Opitutus sp.]